MRLHARIAIVALSSLAAGAFPACSRSASHSERANVILVVIDGLRADHLTPYGYSRNTSPFLDELASRSVLFENAISQSSWTKTSVASLLTSLYPDAHGVRTPTDVLPASARLLPEVLQEHGYRTCGIHGNPWLEERFGFDQGFDDFRFTHWNKDTFDAEELNEQALQCLEENSDRPFFLYLHYMDAHTPWRPPAEFDDFGPAHVDKYDGSIRYLDSRLGDLHDQLRERGLLDDTWILVTADHGEEFGERGNKIGHGLTLYREVLHVPLVIRRGHRQQAAPGRRVRRQVRLIDVAPTILDLVGLSIPDLMEGVSLAANVVDAYPGPVEDLEAFSQVGRHGAARDRDLIAVTTSEFKYILDFEGGAEELYELSGDPAETRNLAAQNPALSKYFKDKVLSFRSVQLGRRIEAVPGAEIDGELQEQLRALGYIP